MGKFFSGSTLSFLEIFVGIAIAACIIFITLFIVKLIKGRGHRVSTFFKFILALISILAIVWNGYCWLWNSGYYTESFGEKSGLETAGTSKKDLYAATEFFAQKLNELSGSCLLYTSLSAVSHCLRVSGNWAAMHLKAVAA